MEEGSDPFYSSCIANSVFNAFLSYTAVMLNILTVHAMRKTSSLPKTLKTLLLSLAVSDLGVGLLVQPLYVTRLVICPIKDFANCMPNAFAFKEFMDFLNYLISYASFLSVMALSVDRFLAVHLHRRYQELVTHKRVVAAVITIWVLSVLLSLIGFFSFKIKDITVALIFGFCFICTTIIYCKIYFTERRHTNQIQIQVNAVKLRKSAVGTFYVYLVFLFCYLPRYCILVWFISIHKPNTTFWTVGLYTWTLLFLNSSLNPVVYCWKMRHIRRSIICILCNIFLRNN